MPDPDNVSSGDLYNRFGNTENALADVFETAEAAIRNPDEAEGWAAILIPAVVTGVAVALVRKVVF